MPSGHGVATLPGHTTSSPGRFRIVRLFKTEPALSRCGPREVAARRKQDLSGRRLKVVMRAT